MSAIGASSYPGPLTVRAPLPQHRDATDGACGGSLRSHGMQVAAVRYSSAKETAGAAVPSSSSTRITRVSGQRPTRQPAVSLGSEPHAKGGDKVMASKAGAFPQREEAAKRVERTNGARADRTRPALGVATPSRDRSQSRETVRQGNLDEAPIRGGGSLTVRSREDNGPRAPSSLAGSMRSQPACDIDQTAAARWRQGEADSSFEGPMLRKEAHTRSPSPSNPERVDSQRAKSTEAKAISSRGPARPPVGSTACSRQGRAGQQRDGPRSLSRDRSASRNGSRTNLDRTTSPAPRAKSPTTACDGRRGTTRPVSRGEGTSRIDSRRSSSAEPRVMERGARDVQNRSVPRARPTSQCGRAPITAPLRRGSGSGGSCSAGSLPSGSLRLRAPSVKKPSSERVVADYLNSSGAESPGLGRPQFQDHRDIQPSPHRYSGRPLGTRGVVVPPMGRPTDGPCRHPMAMNPTVRPDQASCSSAATYPWTAIKSQQPLHLMRPLSWQEEASVAAGPLLVGEPSLASYPSLQGNMTMSWDPEMDPHAHGGEVVWHAAQQEAEIWSGSAREEMFLDQHRPVAGRPPEIRPPRSETVVYDSGIAEGQYAPRASMMPELEKKPLDRSLYNDNAMGIMRHLVAADSVVLDTDMVFGDDDHCMDGASHNGDLGLSLLHPVHCDVAAHLEEDEQHSAHSGDLDEINSLPSPSVMRAAADMNNGLSQETSAMFRCSSPLSPIQESGEPGAPSPSQAIEARNRLEQQRLQEKVAGRDELSAADYGGGYPREGNMANMPQDSCDAVKNPLPASSRARYWQIRERFLAP